MVNLALLACVLRATTKKGRQLFPGKQEKILVTPITPIRNRLDSSSPVLKGNDVQYRIVLLYSALTAVALSRGGGANRGQLLIHTGVARICCEEGQRWKLCHGAFTVDQGQVQQLIDE